MLYIVFGEWSMEISGVVIKEEIIKVEDLINVVVEGEGEGEGSIRNKTSKETQA